MRIAIAACVTLLAGSAPTIVRYVNTTTTRVFEPIVVNDNRTPSGTLANGELTIRLEAREGEWHPDRDADPGLIVRAFAEEGKPLRIPGPLIRVPEGTIIHAYVRNSLRDSTLIVTGLSPRGNASAPADTMRVKPGEVGEVRFPAGAPGTYYYRGTTDVGSVPGAGTMDAELNGALIVDPRGTAGPPRDRVFVIGLWSKRPTPGGVIQPGAGQVIRFTINGKAWPNTERVSYVVGDTVQFRLINVSVAVHPMHLHGFYFNVDSRGDGARDSTYDRGGSPHQVVTERLTPGRTFTMHWVPERPGNWMFHCHDNFHVLRNDPLDGTQLVPEQEVHAHNHALEMMGGLVMGIEVRGTGVVQASGDPMPRRLRLIARADTGGTAAEPAYRYVLQAGTRRYASASPVGVGPTILLKRGEPVSITVVNELAEPTAVHWHGIELDSYYDGVAGFAGHPGRIAPAIAPRDSFEARFTPPRAGTFIYHPHADEVRQQRAGLVGALIVVDSLEKFDAERDIVLLMSVPRSIADEQTAVFVNGSKSPPARELRAGERYRIRLVDIHTFRPSMIMRLLRDSTPVTWRAIAKDGMDLPTDQATVRPAVQQMGNGETYDFELIPTSPGDLRFTVSSGAGQLLASMAIHVR